LAENRRGTCIANTFRSQAGVLFYTLRTRSQSVKYASRKEPGTTAYSPRGIGRGGRIRHTVLSEEDKGRLRENMNALKDTPKERALAERYTGEPENQETQLAKVLHDIAGPEARKMAARRQLSEMIGRRTFDAEI
jgi:hypothetical protein